MNATLLPGALPPIRQAPSIAPIAQNVAEHDAGRAPGVEPAYDVFISHATEDKDLVRPLAHALTERDVAVWYDEFELNLGDSLRGKIDQGLANSRFGVVVFSHSFFAKDWPKYELDGLVTRDIAGGGGLILPLWHEISKDELMARTPSLADKVALRTSDYTIDELAEQIASVVSTPVAARMPT